MLRYQGGLLCCGRGCGNDIEYIIDACGNAGELVAQVEASASDEDLPRARRRCAPRNYVSGQNTGLGSLPLHLWSAVSQYTDLGTIHNCIQGCTWLYEAFQTDGLWLQYLLLRGLVRPVEENTFSLAAEPGIDWIRLVQLHQQMNSGLFVWVRIQKTDVRVPLPLVATYSANVLLFELHRLLRREHGPARHRRTQMRLRLLQSGGHPGVLVQERAVQAGGALLLELALPGGKGWPLPPRDFDSEASTHPAQQRLSGIASLGTGRSWQSLLSHGDVPVPMAQPEMEPDVSGETALEQSMLVRIVSLLVPAAVWVSVTSRGSLGDLYRCIVEGLMRESPLLAGLRSPLSVHLMNSYEPTRPAGLPTSRPLRNIFWTQSETVRVELDIRGGLSALSLLIWRGSAYQEILHSLPPVAEDSPGSHFKPHVLTELETLCSRFVEANRKWPEQKAIDCSDDKNRQVISVLLNGCGPEARWDSSSKKHLPFLARGGAWPRRREPPKVLLNTLKARQFEFHPSLPDVILTGDLYGCVNVVNDAEVKDTHPALCVGQNPLLALVWMKHHPQHAISGVAHSGEIVFLRYDPFTAMAEPTMQTIHNAENFAQLSCLSINSTDDYMLASGLPPEFALYDVATGKVIERASGCHTDTINTASFSNTAPHVFVTASFDHTCKIWDLRQPLLGTKAVKTLCTGGRNIMCTFAPDDRHIQCSGVDTHLVQFEVPSWRRTPERFSLREPVYEDRFRRSCYMPDGCRIATAATEEAFVHVMSLRDGSIVEAVDFEGLRYQRPWARDMPGAEALSSFSASGTTSPFGLPEAAGDPIDYPTLAGEGPAGERAHRDRSCGVFVQSLRAHPDPSLGRLGVLLRPQRGKRSCVVLLDGVR